MPLSVVVTLLIALVTIQCTLVPSTVEAFGTHPSTLRYFQPSTSTGKNKKHEIQTTINGFVPIIRHHDLIQNNLVPQQLGQFEPIDLLELNDAHNNTDNKAITRARASRRVWLYDFVTTSSQNPHSKTIPYQEAWDFQKILVENQLQRIGKKPKDPPLYGQFVPENVDPPIPHSSGSDDEKVSRLMDIVPTSFLGCDSIIILEHDPVYTLGTASDPTFIRGNNGDDTNGNKSPVPVVRIERGGEVTYHGPGQLVVYPILDLRGYKQDIHWYMRALEEVIIIALEKAGIQGATREENLTGVWVSNKKIAALGIKTRRWVTMHGLSINIDARSLQNFDGIVPCGLEGREVTCLSKEMSVTNGKALTLKDVAIYVKEALEDIFGVALLSAY
ncbi:hypothetical protein ACHAXS_013917 [Conticribra weissflogii]